jgi:hypothetical protein
VACEQNENKGMGLWDALGYLLLRGFAALGVLTALVIGWAFCMVLAFTDWSDRSRERPPLVSLPDVAPDTPAERLLPSPPKWDRPAVYVGDNLESVPLVRFEAEQGPSPTLEQWQQRTAWTVAAALHLNAKEQDGFLKAMLRRRPDLDGLPFAMGAGCRSDEERMEQFKEMAELAHRRNSEGLLSALQEKSNSDEALRQTANVQLAAVRQVHGPSGDDKETDMVRYLAAASVPEATDELARVAAFSPSQAVRQEAVRALSVRLPARSGEVLATALRYPWPSVARNAASAIAKLKRTDLVPKLVDALEAPDPRAPGPEKGADGEAVASELVRIEHRTSCLLCHAPVEPLKRKSTPLVAEFPLPSHLDEEFSRGYDQSEEPKSNLLVRIDVTYLRQDFSVVKEVRRKGLVGQERFDFLVRRRKLNVAEAEGLRKRLEAEKQGGLSPYQRAAYRALRDLTGRDLGPKAEDWRRALDLKPS